MYGLPSYACVSIEQFSVERGIRELHVRHGTGNAVVYPDLPIWGKLEIYDSPSDAVSAQKINGGAKKKSISVCFGCIVVETSEDCFYIVVDPGLPLVYWVSSVCTYVTF